MLETPQSLTSDEPLVTESFSGKQWIMPSINDRQALALSQRFGLSDIVSRILTSRGIDADTTTDFLEPRLKNALAGLADLKDMDKAAVRITKAIQSGEKLTIFGDYDVDGATSSALMSRYLTACGHTNHDIYIPDRIDEGYGPNKDALQSIKDSGASLVIMVDCGITGFDALSFAQSIGLDVVVFDHHTAEPNLPEAVAVVNPNRLDEDGSLGHLAAVGVVFLGLIALTKTLRADGFFEQRAEPDLLALLDIVALGTVCDVVSLTGLNRALVAQGLKVMAKRGNHGIKALFDVASLDEAPKAFHAGFVLGPRINAGGRIGDSSLGAKLLCSDDSMQCAEIAAQLHAHNDDRKDMEKRALDQAIDMIEDRKDTSDFVICVGHENWHPGVIGIVAARLKERYNRPALVMAFEDGLGKGSGRSIKGIDLGNAVIAARQSGLLVAGGGHAMAAGFTIEQGKIPIFEQFLEERFIKLHGQTPLKPVVSIDCLLGHGGVTVELARELSQLEPFGSGNNEPRFAMMNARIVKADILKDTHLRLIVGDAQGSGGFPVMAWRVVGTPLGKALLNAAGRPVHLAGTVRINNWRGNETAQFILDDAAAAW